MPKPRPSGKLLLLPHGNKYLLFLAQLTKIKTFFSSRYKGQAPDLLGKQDSVYEGIKNFLVVLNNKDTHMFNID